MSAVDINANTAPCRPRSPSTGAPRSSTRNHVRCCSALSRKNAQVSDEAFNSSYQKLLDSLDQTVALLREHSEHHWATGLEVDRGRIADGDGHALDHLLSAFGGMGSLNDLVLHGPTPGAPWNDALRAANDRLSDLRESIWRAAVEIRAELRGQ